MPTEAGFGSIDFCMIRYIDSEPISFYTRLGIHEFAVKEAFS